MFLYLINTNLIYTSRFKIPEQNYIPVLENNSFNGANTNVTLMLYLIFSLPVWMYDKNCLKSYNNINYIGSNLIHN
jgi:hypothetical protein